MNNSKTPGDLILAILKKRNMTQRAMASACGISVPFLNDLINGRKDMPMKRAIEIQQQFPDFDAKRACELQLDITFKREYDGLCQCRY